MLQRSSSMLQRVGSYFGVENTDSKLDLWKEKVQRKAKAKGFNISLSNLLPLDLEDSDQDIRVLEEVLSNHELVIDEDSSHLQSFHSILHSGEELLVSSQVFDDYNEAFMLQESSYLQSGDDIVSVPEQKDDTKIGMLQDASAHHSVCFNSEAPNNHGKLDRALRATLDCESESELTDQRKKSSVSFDPNVSVIEFESKKHGSLKSILKLGKKKRENVYIQDSPNSQYQVTLNMPALKPGRASNEDQRRPTFDGSLQQPLPSVSEQENGKGNADEANTKGAGTAFNEESKQYPAEDMDQMRKELNAPASCLVEEVFIQLDNANIEENIVDDQCHATCKSQSEDHRVDFEHLLTDYKDDEHPLTGNNEGEHPLTDYKDDEQPRTDYKDDEHPLTDYKDDEHPLTDYKDDEHPLTDYKDDEQPLTDYNKGKHPLKDYNECEHSLTDYKDGKHSTTDYKDDKHPLADYKDDEHPLTDYKDDEHPLTDYKDVEHPLTDYKDDEQPLTDYKDVEHPLTDYKDDEQPLTDYNKGKHPLKDYNECEHSLTDYKDGKHSTTDYKDDKHPLADYKDDEHPLTDYKDDEHPLTDYKDDEHPLTDYKDVEHPLTDYKDDEQPLTDYNKGEHPLKDYNGDEHPLTDYKDGKHPLTDNKDGKHPLTDYKDDEHPLTDYKDREHPDNNDGECKQTDDNNREYPQTDDINKVIDINDRKCTTDDNTGVCPLADDSDGKHSLADDGEDHHTCDNDDHQPQRDDNYGKQPLTYDEGENTLTDDRNFKYLCTEDNKGDHPQAGNKGDKLLTDDNDGEHPLTDDNDGKCLQTNGIDSEHQQTDNKGKLLLTDDNDSEYLLTDDNVGEHLLTDDSDSEYIWTDDNVGKHLLTDDNYGKNLWTDDNDRKQPLTDNNGGECPLTADINGEHPQTNDKHPQTGDNEIEHPQTDDNDSGPLLTSDKIGEPKWTDANNTAQLQTDVNEKNHPWTDNTDGEQLLIDENAGEHVVDDDIDEPPLDELLTGSEALDYYNKLCKVREELGEIDMQRAILHNLRKHEELLDAVMETAKGFFSALFALCIGTGVWATFILHKIHLFSPSPHGRNLTIVVIRFLKERQVSALSRPSHLPLESQGSLSRRKPGYNKVMPHPTLSSHVRMQIEGLPDYKPYGTLFISFIQFIVFFAFCYRGGLAPIGLRPKTVYLDRVKTFRGTETVVSIQYPNVWIGPTAAYWIRYGAVYSPCLRSDYKINAMYAKQGYQEATNSLGCCEVKRRNSAGTTTEEECFTFTYGAGLWNPIQCGYRRAGGNNVAHILKPCCYKLTGECKLTTHRHCTFMGGYYQAQGPEHCSQVNCLSDVCGFNGLTMDAHAVIAYVPTRPNQWWRLLISPLYHHGIVHLLLVLIPQLILAIPTERMAGGIRLLLIYMLSAIIGNLLAALFTPYLPHMGGSAAVCGLIAVQAIELAQSWVLVKRPLRTILKLLVIIVLFLFSGTLPFIDNFAHIGGLATGLLTACIFLPYIVFGEWHSRRRRMILILSVPVLVVLVSVLLLLFYKIQYIGFCPSCQYINCISYTPYLCNSTWYNPQPNQVFHQGLHR